MAGLRRDRDHEQRPRRHARPPRRRGHPRRGARPRRRPRRGDRRCPVSADLENGFGDDEDAVAETIRGALAAGLAGASIEDSTGQSDGADIYDRDLAAARVAAAVEVAHGGDVRFVLTARCENHLHGRDDLADTIARLQAYGAAGADVLYAPGLTSLDDIRSVVAAVDQPVNVLALPGAPTVAELADAGVARISVGGAFAFAALGGAVAAARELRESGTYGFWTAAGAGSKAAKQAFARPLCAAPRDEPV